MNGLSAREQRLIAIAILVACLASIWVLVVAPILDGFAARREARATAESSLDHDMRLLASFSALRVQALAVQRFEPAWSVPGATATVATEAARERVTQAVADSGGTLEALRDEPSGPNIIHLQADVETGLDGLQGLVRRLENERPYGAIDKLSVAAAEAAATPRPSALQARIDVSFSHVASR